jgi:hypothetical protein
MEILQSYPRRFLKRYLKEATPWARDNIVWSALVVIVPPLAEYLNNPRTTVDWNLFKNTLILYGFALVVYVLARLPFTARHLDDERDLRERALEGIVSEKDLIIRQREDEIRGLREKPKRSAAEEQDYQKAKEALRLIGKPGIAAMRFLRDHGAVTAIWPGMPNPRIEPQLPSEITIGVALHAYHHCASVGIVTAKRNLGVSEETFSINPRWEKILDELLFED